MIKVIIVAMVLSILALAVRFERIIKQNERIEEELQIAPAPQKQKKTPQQIREAIEDDQVNHFFS